MRRLLFALLCMICLSCSARQLHSMANGNWEDSTTWFNSMLPDSVNDTIIIMHRISLHSTIILSTNDYLTIDTGASLCGNDSLYMYNNSLFINGGFTGFYYMELNGGFCENAGLQARMDVGQAGISDNGAGFEDSLGCVIVHNGPQACLYTCTFDSTIFVHIDSNVVTFELDTTGLEYEYYFGDGDSELYYTTYYNVHKYADTGTYHVAVMGLLCCSWDTLYTTVHITGTFATPPPPPPPVPECTDTFAFVMGPNPANTHIDIFKQLCADTIVSVKVYTMLGQLVYNHSFTTTHALLAEQVNTTSLTPGCYLLDAEVAGNYYLHKKIIVVH